MKELIELLEERGLWNYGDAKPCEIYINQAYRKGAVVASTGDNYNVAYVMPNGRKYVKKVSGKEAERVMYTGQTFLQIDLKNSINNDGTTFSAFGF